MKKAILIGIILLAAILRFYKLGSVPPSLYWDEASLGYNAYAIATTAHDEFGKFLPRTHFDAFGDYKPPGYIYAAALSVKILGLSEFAIRFPSALFGVLTVLLAYFLAKKLFESETVALTASLFLAISPWHLQMSRGAFEGNLGLFFSTLGVYLFVKFAKDRPFWIFPSALSFLAGMYTFTGQRLFVPFILIVLFIQFKNEIIKNIKFVLAAGVIAAILFWPLFVFATQTLEGRLRFEEVTIFKDLEPINTSIKYREQDGFSPVADITHNRRFFYIRNYLIHYFDAFDPRFLFTRGDVNPRLSIQDVGHMYYIDILFVLSGVYFLIAKKNKYRFLILGWLLVSPLGPATARETPHALRMIHILPTFQLIGAYGIYQLYKTFKYKKALLVFCGALLSLHFMFYLHMYYVHWPRTYSSDWQYGYKQAVEVVKSEYQNVDHVIVTTQQGRPYIYFLLYMKVNPSDFWAKSTVEKDRFFFIDVKGFDKFIFTGNIDDVPVSGKILYVAAPGAIPVGAEVIETVKNLNGDPVFTISKKTL